MVCSLGVNHIYVLQKRSWEISSRDVLRLGMAKQEDIMWIAEDVAVEKGILRRLQISEGRMVKIS